MTRYARPPWMADVEDLDDARRGWIRLTARASLKKRSTCSRVVGDLGVQHLDRDLRPDALLLGEVHLAHAALAELAHHAEVTDLRPDHSDQNIRSARDLRGGASAIRGGDRDAQRHARAAQRVGLERTELVLERRSVDQLVGDGERARGGERGHGRRRRDELRGPGRARRGRRAAAAAAAGRVTGDEAQHDERRGRGSDAEPRDPPPDRRRRAEAAGIGAVAAPRASWPCSAASRASCARHASHAATCAATRADGDPPSSWLDSLQRTYQQGITCPPRAACHGRGATSPSFRRRTCRARARPRARCSRTHSAATARVHLGAEHARARSHSAPSSPATGSTGNRELELGAGRALAALAALLCDPVVRRHVLADREQPGREPTRRIVAREVAVRARSNVSCATSSASSDTASRRARNATKRAQLHDELLEARRIAAPRTRGELVDRAMVHGYLVFALAWPSDISFFSSAVGNVASSSTVAPLTLTDT